MRALLHLDADAFFASVEQVLDARLRGKPVVVGGSYRGVVCSASYEARRFGIHSAMPIARAEQLCPQAVFLPGQFERYEEFSRALFKLCRDYAPEVEETSIDEGYLDLTGTERAHRLPYPRIARALQKNIEQALAITVSEGLATNKTLAKVASDLHKPRGLVVVPRGTEKDFLAPLQLRCLPGAGPVLTRRLLDYGIHTIGEFARLPREWIQVTLGRCALLLHQQARGIDPRPVRPTRHDPQSYSQQVTFAADTIDHAQVLAVARGSLERLLVQLRADRRQARTLTLRLRYSDFQEISRSRSMAEPLDIDPPFQRLLAELLPVAWHRRVRIRQVAVRLSGIYTSPPQLDLFDPHRDRLARLYRCVDSIRERYGFEAVRPAAALARPPLPGPRRPDLPLPPEPQFLDS